jgi:hypothetical protein
MVDENSLEFPAELPLDPTPPPPVDVPLESSSSAAPVDAPLVIDAPVLPEVPAPEGALDIPYVLPELPQLPPVDPILVEDLQSLHNIINAIAPIVGISVIEDAPGEIEYVTPPTPEQETQIAAAISGWNSLRVKNSQLRLIEASWQATIAMGWTTPYGWKLGLTPKDITLLTGAFILAKEAQIKGLATSGVIVDTDGLAHELPVADLTGLMLQYGQARAALSAAYAASKAALG